MNYADWMAKELRAVNRFRAQLDQTRQAWQEEKAALKAARREEAAALAARDILAGLALTVQQQAHQRIAAVVSSCLAAVFDEPYEFRLHFEPRRGRTEARIVFYRDGLEIHPMEAAGGGAVDVAAFALRAACLVLHRPRLRPLLVLDEPFRFVSEQYRPAVRTMLEKLAEDLRLQIVMVTHMDDLEAGKVVTL